MSLTPVPAPTLRRLPAYRHHVRGLNQRGVAAVSCSLIARDLGFEPAQIRKDLELTGIAGKPKVGYPVPDLLKAIENFLGWDKARDAFLVGAGGLGQALLSYEQIEQFGLRITRAFDLDHRYIGQRVQDQEVLPVGHLPDLARRLQVRIGILTVPAISAQSVADLMVRGGMRAIWNFAPVNLQVPGGVIVQNEDFYYSLAALSYKLAHRDAAGAAGEGSQA